MYAFEDYLDPETEHSLPVGSDVDIHINPQNIYGEADYSLESENVELQVMTEFNRGIVYVQDNGLTQEDELVLDYAETILSGGRGESVNLWAERVTDESGWEQSSKSDFAMAD